MPEFEEIEVGDIVKTTAGIRVVEFVGDNTVQLRPIALGMDDAYKQMRPRWGGGWMLLARGAERYTPFAQRFVR